MDLVVGCATRPYAAWSFAQACERIASVGYTDVALFLNEGRIPVSSESSTGEIVKARKVAVGAGLRPSMLLGRTMLDLGLEKAVEDYSKLIENAARLGSEWLLDCGTGDQNHYDAYYELMRQVMPTAEDCGVKVVLKPHGGITLAIDDLLRANEKVDHPNFGICYDPGNIVYYTRGELRPETGVERVAPVVQAGIVKDCVIRDGVPDVMVTPGEGLVDFEKVLSGLVRGGFHGPLYVECVRGSELEEMDRNIRSTLAFVNRILAGL